MYGMVSVTPLSKDPPLATRLRLLRDREQAWKTLAWRDQQALTLPPTGSVYEFIGGIYANGKEDERKVTSSISFFELPSSADEPIKAWRHSMGDISVVDFTMDPAQDLIALVALAPPESVLHLLNYFVSRLYQTDSLPDRNSCTRSTSTRSQRTSLTPRPP